MSDDEVLWSDTFEFDHTFKAEKMPGVPTDSPHELVNIAKLIVEMDWKTVDQLREEGADYGKMMNQYIYSEGEPELFCKKGKIIYILGNATLTVLKLHNDGSSSSWIHVLIANALISDNKEFMQRDKTGLH